MTHQWLRCNLNSAVFPLATELWGRSVIIPQQDENYEKVLVSGTDLAKDKGIPQAYYMHNCMPTGQGYQAIGYDTQVDGLIGEDSFDDAFPIQTPDLNRYIFSPAGGKNFIYDLNLGGWVSTNPWPAGTILNSTTFTTAQVQGQTYIGISLVGVFIYNSVTKQLEQQFITGGTPGAGDSGGLEGLLGICSANGYAIYWNSNSLAWSATDDPLNIAPSLITGAGGGSLNEAKGRIVVCLPISNGFMVYCEKNVVAAQYTGNIDYPFRFRQVEGSAGVLTEERVSWQSNSSSHYAWTTAGLMQLDLNSAVTLFPELTAFLAEKLYEDFDEDTLALTSTYIDSNLQVKLSMVQETYVVISYGLPGEDFTYALVYDISLSRWGKLKITHVDCFQWNSPGGAFDLTYGQLLDTSYEDLLPYSYADLFAGIIAPADKPKHTLALLQSNGSVQIVNFDLSEATADGVLILGKYQAIRNRRIQHQRTEIECRGKGTNFDAYVITTQDGKTWDTPKKMTVYPFKPTSLNRVYGKVCEGENFTLLFTGSFNAVSAQTDYTMGGQT